MFAIMVVDVASKLAFTGAIVGVMCSIQCTIIRRPGVHPNIAFSPEVGNGFLAMPCIRHQTQYGVYTQGRKYVKRLATMNDFWSRVHGPLRFPALQSSHILR